jgi:hypothetical protein
LGEVPGLRLLGLLGLVLGEVPGLRLLGLVLGEVPGLRLLGLVLGEVPGLRLLGLLMLLGLLGFVPAGVVMGVPAASLVIPLGLALGGLAVLGLAVVVLGLFVAAGVVFLPHKLTKSKVVPLEVSM